MPKVAVAERILETVTTPSRASSIIGDLLEETSNRNALQFWFSVLRIFSSHIFQDLRTHWLRMIWLGSSGFVKFIVLLIPIVLFTQIVVRPKFSMTPSGFWIITEILVYAAKILTCWHIAKRSRGCELASGFAFASAMGIFSMFGVFMSHLWTFAYALALIPDFALPIAVALLFRYRANARSRKQLLEKS